jgi:hypothetical protein
MTSGAGQPIATKMNVAGGFSGAPLFYYFAIGRKPEVTIYSGLNGGGMKLADKTFDLTGKELANAVFSAEQNITFSGTALSVVFTGGNDQLALDNISFAKVPEPSGWICLTTGLGCSYLALARRRRRKPVARKTSRRHFGDLAARRWPVTPATGSEPASE